VCVHASLKLTYWSDIHYLHHGVYHITMSDVMMNVHPCVTDNTIYTMVYIISLCQDIQHDVSSVISNTCVYIRHYIWHSDMIYNMEYIVLSVKRVCTCIIKTDILIWHATWWNEGVQEKYKKEISIVFWNGCNI
jgi:hypothetical protein